MNYLQYVAGVSSCTPEQETQKMLGILGGIAIFLIISAVAWKLLRGGRNKSTGKLEFSKLFGLFCIMGLGALAGFFAATWVDFIVWCV